MTPYLCDVVKCPEHINNISCYGGNLFDLGSFEISNNRYWENFPLSKLDKVKLKMTEN